MRVRHRLRVHSVDIAGRSPRHCAPGIPPVRWRRPSRRWGRTPTWWSTTVGRRRSCRVRAQRRGGRREVSGRDCAGTATAMDVGRGAQDTTPPIRAAPMTTIAAMIGSETPIRTDARHSSARHPALPGHRSQPPEAHLRTSRRHLNATAVCPQMLGKCLASLGTARRTLALHSRSGLSSRRRRFT